MSFEASCWSHQGVLGGGDASCERLAEVGHCCNCPVLRDAALAVERRPLPDDEFESRVPRLEARTAPAPGGGEAWLVLVAGRGTWGFPLRAGVRVLERPACTRVPTVDPARFPGLVNVEGRVRPCVALAALLGEADPSRPEGFVATDLAGGFVLACRTVEGIEVHPREPARRLEGLPEICLGYAGGLERPIGLLDPERLAAALERIRP